jgi:hypothetical protein
VAIPSLLISFNGRTLGCGPGDAEFDSPSQDQIPVLVQWQNAGLQNPMSTVRFSQPVPNFFSCLGGPLTGRQFLIASVER